MVIISHVIHIVAVKNVFRCMLWYNRARVKLLLEISAEDPVAIVEAFGTQILQEDVLPLTSQDFAAVVDAVTTEDVNQVYCSLLVAIACLGCAVV